jgi:hypothetical protein
MVSKDALAAFLQDELIKRGMLRNKVRGSEEYIKLYGEYSKRIK